MFWTQPPISMAAPNISVTLVLIMSLSSPLGWLTEGRSVPAGYAFPAEMSCDERFYRGGRVKSWSLRLFSSVAMPASGLPE